MKHAALNAIHMYMNHIYEKEEEGIEIFLSDRDFETVRKRRDLPLDEKILRFEPRYSIRPSVDQVSDNAVLAVRLQRFVAFVLSRRKTLLSW